MQKVKLVEQVLRELLTLVFTTLAQAEVDGLTLPQANRILEDAICKKYEFDRGVIVGLVAGGYWRR